MIRDSEPMFRSKSEVFSLSRRLSPFNFFFSVSGGWNGRVAVCRMKVSGSGQVWYSAGMARVVPLFGTFYFTIMD